MGCLCGGDNRLGWWHRLINGQTRLHDSPDKLAVVSLVDDELERDEFPRFVVVCRDLSVLFVGVFTGLKESLTFFF